MSIRLRDLAVLLAIAGVLGGSIACRSEDGPDESTASTAAAEAAPAAEAADTTSQAKPRRTERPLPAFSGFSLGGERKSASDLLGRRAVVVFFDAATRPAETVLRGVQQLTALRGPHNFELLGVASGASRAEIESFVERTGLGFDVIDDSSRRIWRRFGMQEPVTVLGVDPDGYVMWGFAHFDTTHADASDRIADQFRERLRIEDAAAPAPGDRPLAPTFTASVLDSDQRFDLAQHRGQAVLLVFFLHTCPHCHDALGFIKTALEELPHGQRPLLVGLEITGRTADVRRAMEEFELDFFPVLFDDHGHVKDDYGVFGGVPDIFLIDAEGRIAARSQGWSGERDAPLLRMRMAKEAGAPVPMLLSREGYSGSEVCGVCHGVEYDTWQLTTHASAFDTLVTHAANTDPECVGCHVVGFGETGGFEISPPTPTLEDVGCESCHGRGGPHLSPEFRALPSYESTCVGCHDTKHSLGFEYATFLPEVSHAANAHILELPAEERRAILAERGAMRTDLLPTSADHVGSEACRSCHPAEYATWSANPHASAVATLEAKGEAANADCLRCHTTGFDRPGGFPAGALVADHSDLARVGCESCHGPGGNHVAEDAKKLGTIVSLGDKCDSCVILQICGGCHDQANDPGFEFAVQDKIDRIRHGTIEAGTGKPLGESARAPSERELLQRAFASHAGGDAWPH